MPRLRDGVIKRGGSWSYVIRVRDPATGVSRPRWVGGFGTEEEAKAARDEARVRARRGGYVNRSTSTVAGYLTEWLEAHASTGTRREPSMRTDRTTPAASSSYSLLREIASAAAASGTVSRILFIARFSFAPQMV